MGGTETDRNYGKAAHRMIELEINKKLDVSSLDDGLLNAYSGWLKFRKDFPKYKPVTDGNGCSLIERPLYHKDLDYCGTPDLPLTDGKEIVLFDIKNSSGNAPHWGVQTVAYVPLILIAIGKNPTISNMLGIKRRLLRLDHSSPTYNILKCESISDWNVWLSALQIFKWKVSNGFSFDF
jgi:hypothetical protein